MISPFIQLKELREFRGKQISVSVWGKSKSSWKSQRSNKALQNEKRLNNSFVSQGVLLLCHSVFFFLFIISVKWKSFCLAVQMDHLLVSIFCEAAEAARQRDGMGETSQ